VIEEILRLGLAWAICTVVVVFWYYIMSRLGSF
jgi:4-amino-4-deoxy-L-arabinose transferase-like glycosyltransferase